MRGLAFSSIREVFESSFYCLRILVIDLAVYSHELKTEQRPLRDITVCFIISGQFVFVEGKACFLTYMVLRFFSLTFCQVLLPRKNICAQLGKS